MAEEACLARRTDTCESTHMVDTSGPIQALGLCTVVDVALAVSPCPSVDTDTGETACRVDTGCPIVTDPWGLSALVNVLFAVRTSVAGRTEAFVPCVGGSVSWNTCRSMCTGMTVLVTGVKPDRVPDPSLWRSSGSPSVIHF